MIEDHSPMTTSARERIRENVMLKRRVGHRGGRIILYRGERYGRIDMVPHGMHAPVFEFYDALNRGVPNPEREGAQFTVRLTTKRRARRTGEHQPETETALLDAAAELIASGALRPESDLARERDERREAQRQERNAELARHDRVCAVLVQAADLIGALGAIHVMPDRRLLLREGAHALRKLAGGGINVTTELRDIFDDFDPQE
jgi:hypothetical protein